MWVYLDFLRRSHREQWFAEHPIGIRTITGLTLTTPVPLLSGVNPLSETVNLAHLDLSRWLL